MVRTGFTDPALTIVSFAASARGVTATRGLAADRTGPECADSEHGGEILGRPWAAG